jgi:hypothetical protein
VEKTWPQNQIATRLTAQRRLHNQSRIQPPQQHRLDA